MARSKGFSKSITVRHILTAITCLVFVVLVAAVLRDGTTKAGNGNNVQSASNSHVAQTTADNPYAVLAPATVPSKTPECSQPISYQSNGNSGPITCADGDLNVTEWNALSALEPKVMSLGYSPSAQTVQSTLCTDASDSSEYSTTKDSNIIESTTYQISALYYGWNFNPSPVSVLGGSGC